MGLPVYNAERYVASAISAHLAQTFGDFELIISDNASVDGTAEICHAFALKDDRIRLVRASTNRGLNWNHRRVFELAGTEFFRWASADDLPSDGLLHSCVEELDATSDIIGCLPHTLNIDALGLPIETRAQNLDLTSKDPCVRALSVLGATYQMTFVQGLFRRIELERARMRWNFVGYDFVLLLELALRGRMTLPAGAVLRRRLHDGQATASLHRLATMHEFEPNSKAIAAFPHWRWAAERLRSVTLADLPVAARTRIAMMILRHEWWRRDRFLQDLLRAANLTLGRSDQTPYRL